MASVDDQLAQLTAQISRLVRLFGGPEGNAIFANVRRTGADPQTKAAQESTTKLGRAFDGMQKSLGPLTASFKNLAKYGLADPGAFLEELKRGSSSFAASAAAERKNREKEGGGTTLLRLVEVGGAVSGAFVALFHSALKLTQSYSKLSDIGQNFGGDILAMGQSAGRAGLSLSEYTEFLTRNSTVTAVLGTGLDDLSTEMSKLTGHVGNQAEAASKGTKSFQKYENSIDAVQSSVRDQLEANGFYGMSLKELSNTTSDYLETLRQTGRLTQMETTGRSLAIKTLISEASAMSKMYGISREQIIKSTNDALRDAAFASRMQRVGNEQIMQSATKAAVALSAIPGGAQMAAALTETIGSGIPAGMTTFGQQMVAAGVPGINALMGEIARRVEGGEDVSTPEFQADFQKRLYDTLNMQAPVLERLVRLGGATGEAAKAALAMKNSMQGVATETRAEMIARFKREKDEADHAKDVTKAVTLFESEFHKVTGAFRDNFFESISQFMGDGKTSSDAMKAFQDAMATAGKAVGSFIGNFFTPARIATFASALTIVGKGLEGLATVAGWLVTAFTTLSKVTEWVTQKLSLPQMVTAIAGLAVPLILAWVGKRLVGNFFKNLLGHGAAKDMIVKAQNVSVNGIGAGSGAGGLGGGGDFGPAETTKGRIRRRLLGAVGGKIGLAGIGGMVGGAVVKGAGDMAFEKNSGAHTVTDTLGAMLSYGGSGATLGLMIGGPMGAAIGAGLGAAAGGIIANWDTIAGWFSKKAESKPTAGPVNAVPLSGQQTASVAAAVVQAEPVQAKSIEAQLQQLEAAKKDLEIKTNTDSQQGWFEGMLEDNQKMQQLLQTISDLQAKSVKLQQDNNSSVDKTARAARDPLNK